MKIRKLENQDIDEVVELWYETSIEAHSFISSDFCAKNREAMAKKYLPNFETYLAIADNQIVGFIALVDNYLAAIFVKPQMQGKGIGSYLLDYVKDLRDLIQLSVYKRNTNSIQFYKTHGFTILSENKEEETEEIEYCMEWKK